MSSQDMPLLWGEKNSRIIKANLTASEKLILLILFSYADNRTNDCYPSIPTIAHWADLSDRTVQRCLDSLIDRNIVKKETRRKKSRSCDSNLYWIFFENIPLRAKSSRKKTKGGDMVTPSPGDMVTPSPGDMVTPSPGDMVTPSPGDMVTPITDPDINYSRSELEEISTDPITHTDPERVCENFEFENFQPSEPDPEPCQLLIIPPSPAKESASTNNSPSEEDLPPPVTTITASYTPDCDLSSVARFDRTLRTYQPTEDLTAQLVETYNKVKPDHWGKCSQIGVHMPRQVAGLLRRYESPELVAQEWGEACLALKANDFYNSPKFQSGNINFLLDPNKPDRIPQLAQAWRDRPQQQKEQLAHKMVAKANGIPRWENPDVVLTGAMLHLRRDRYARYVTREDFDNPDCPSINYLQTYFPELFTKNA
jgi:Helix-turn-helix domain